MRGPFRVKLLTGNRHKVEEAQAILSKYGIELVMVDDKAVEIQHHDLGEIVFHSIGAALSRGHTPPLLVEDSGLFVVALKGFPGPFSSYVFNTVGLEGILKLMTGVKDRRACFRSAVACAFDHFNLKTFEGSVEGVIQEAPAGVAGFGFDPIFTPEGAVQTFGQMPIEEKNTCSHRARAFDSFAQWYCEE